LADLSAFVGLTHCRRAAQSLVAKYHDRKLKVAFLASCR
jgi:MOSC domain-containing protein YiiM